MPHYSAKPSSFFVIALRYRQLIWQMTKREVVGRYRGSILGLFWSFSRPIFLLCIYTFVFSVVFQAKWGADHSGDKTQFAIILFAGLIIFNLFVEVINRAPNIIVSNVNYVKKVVFPLEVLPLVTTGSALFHTLVSVFVLLSFNILVNGAFPLTVFYLPFILFPLLVFILGCAWFLASLGVFLRDVTQTISILTTALLFLSPVFFPATALPEQLRVYLLLNPLTFIIEQTRQVLVWGKGPDWAGLMLYLGGAAIFACLGFVWFQKTRKGFADVL